MFNKKRRSNPLLFTASLLGMGAAAYYLTKEATQGEDRVNPESYSPDNPYVYIPDEV